MATRAEMLNDAEDLRTKAAKSQYRKQVQDMRRLGIIPPRGEPKAKHFNQLAAHYNSQAAALRATSIQRDLAAFESIGGLGAQIVATLNNPKAKATERAYALQGMIQAIKIAPSVIAAGTVTTDEDDTFTIDDHEIDSIIEEFGGNESSD